MKKQINATGVNGTFTGTIEVELHFKYVYDDEPEYHKITSSVNQNVNIDQYVHPDFLLRELDRTEQKIIKRLRELADKVEVLPEPSIESQLKAKGFI